MSAVSGTRWRRNLPQTETVAHEEQCDEKDQAHEVGHGGDLSSRHCQVGGASSNAYRGKPRSQPDRRVV